MMMLIMMGMMMMMMVMMMIQMILDIGCNKMHKVPRSFNNRRSHFQRGTLAQVICFGWWSRSFQKKRDCCWNIEDYYLNFRIVNCFLCANLSLQNFSGLKMFFFRSCFLCANCSAPLAGQKFASRFNNKQFDNKDTVLMMWSFDHEDKNSNY